VFNKVREAQGGVCDPSERQLDRPRQVEVMQGIGSATTELPGKSPSGSDPADDAPVVSAAVPEDR